MPPKPAPPKKPAPKTPAPKTPALSRPKPTPTSTSTPVHPPSPATPLPTAPEPTASAPVSAPSPATPPPSTTVARAKVRLRPVASTPLETKVRSRRLITPADSASVRRPRPAPTPAPAASTPTPAASTSGPAVPVRTIRFTPRVGGVKQDIDPVDDRFPQGDPPPLKPADPTKPAVAVKLAQTACLVHGMAPEYLAGALASGELGSAYRRVGPFGAYGRDMDKRGGGGLAVYTRAVGTAQRDWQAQGYGVGSSPTKVQLVLSPTFLEANTTWRASSTDGAGKVPGASDADVTAVTRGEKDVYDLWGAQSERGRALAFNGTVVGPKQMNNEQLHWERVPLAGNLKAVVCTDPASFATLMAIPSAAQQDASHGTVPLGAGHVQVLLMAPTDKLLTKLQAAGLANPGFQIR